MSSVYSSPLLNCLNYRVIEETRKVEKFFISSRKLPNCYKDYRRIFNEFEVVQPN